MRKQVRYFCYIRIGRHNPSLIIYSSFILHIAISLSIKIVLKFPIWNNDSFSPINLDERNISLVGKKMYSPRITIDVRARGRTLLRTTLRGLHECPHGVSLTSTHAPVQRRVFGITRRRHHVLSTYLKRLRSCRDCHAAIIRQNARDSNNDRRNEYRIFGWICQYLTTLSIFRCHATIGYDKILASWILCNNVVNIVMDLTESIVSLELDKYVD